MSSSSTTERIKTEALPSEQLLNLAARTASASALLCLSLVLWQTISRSPLPGKPGWAEALLVVTTTIATIAALARQLPGPKVMIAAAIIAILGGAAHAIGSSADRKSVV